MRRSRVVADPSTFVDTLPTYWYVIIGVVIATPLYFLFTAPRKRKNESKWKG